MLSRHLAALAIATTTSAFFAMDASANPRFTVESQSDLNVKIHIFNGNDPSCGATFKSKKLKAGKTKTFGCEGHGTGRCKVKVWYKDIRVCGEANTVCGGTAIPVKNGQRLVLSDESGCYTK